MNFLGNKERTAVNTYYLDSCKNMCYNCYMQLTGK